MLTSQRMQPCDSGPRRSSKRKKVVRLDNARSYARPGRPHGPQEGPHDNTGAGYLAAMPHSAHPEIFVWLPQVYGGTGLRQQVREQQSAETAGGDKAAHNVGQILLLG